MNTFGIWYLPPVIPNAESSSTVESPTLEIIIEDDTAVVDESSPVAVGTP